MRFGGEILNFDVSMHNAYLETGKEDTELSGRGSHGYTHHGFARSNSNFTDVAQALI